MINIGGGKYGYLYYQPVVTEAGYGEFKMSIAKLLNGNNCSEDDYLLMLRFESLLDRLYEEACVDNNKKSTAVRLAENLTRRAFNGTLRQ